MYIILPLALCARVASLIVIKSISPNKYGMMHIVVNFYWICTKHVGNMVAVVNNIVLHITYTALLCARKNVPSCTLWSILELTNLLSFLNYYVWILPLILQCPLRLCSPITSLYLTQIPYMLRMNKWLIVSVHLLLRCLLLMRSIVPSPNWKLERHLVIVTSLQTHWKLCRMMAYVSCYVAFLTIFCH